MEHIKEWQVWKKVELQDKFKWKKGPKEQVFDYFVQDKFKWKKGPKEQVFVDSRQ